MPDLIAQGPENVDRWRKRLPQPGERFLLGRTAEEFAVPWDPRISRAHATAWWDGFRLHIRREATARNPIFFQGAQRDEFALQMGEHFVIGQTSFVLANQSVLLAADTGGDPPAFERSYSPSDLTAVRYRDAGRRIDALSRLPQIIADGGTDETLAIRIVNLLMSTILPASFVAIVQLRESDELIRSSSRTTLDLSEPLGNIEVLHWDSRDLARQSFTPSRSLIRRTFALSQSVLHTWRSLISGSELGDSRALAHTQMANVDWAFCVPVGGPSHSSWAIYVTGSLDQISELAASSSVAESATQSVRLQEELKFAELVATMLAAIRQSRQLQVQQAALQPFFAPVVRDSILKRGGAAALEPRPADVSVLFCDLRGFSRTSERMEDRLLELLQRVSDALGVTTQNILSRGGVVGDFHGDAAMGFWGWPLPSDDYHRQAVEAALAIDQQFRTIAATPDHPLANFRVGVGIASGHAVAGRIGTIDQVKITVFGPVVNLASRLEGMTKHLAAPILIDEETAAAVRKLGPSVARVRRVLKVRPAGMQRPLVVGQLLPPESATGGRDSLSSQNIAAYELALDAFLAGDWDEAFERLHAVPASDRVKDFLTVYIAQHARRPPPTWDGTVDLDK